MPSIMHVHEHAMYVSVQASFSKMRLWQHVIYCICSIYMYIYVYSISLLSCKLLY